MDNRPRDKLGRIARPLRYSIKRTVLLSPAEDKRLQRMLRLRSKKSMTFIREAVMKEIEAIERAKN